MTTCCRTSDGGQPMNRPAKRAKARHQLFLDADLSEKLEALAAKPGASKSAILADAVVAWLNRRGAQELDDRFGLRLNRISAQLNRIERDQQVLLESLARDRKNVVKGRSVSVRVNPGGRRIIKKKKKNRPN